MTLGLAILLFVVAIFIGICLDAARESIRAKAFTMLPVSLIVARATFSLFIGGINAPACCVWVEAAINRGDSMLDVYFNVFVVAFLADTLVATLTDAFYHAEPPK